MFPLNVFHVSAWQALGDMASCREHVSLSQNVLAVWGPFWLKLSQNSFLSHPPNPGLLVIGVWQATVHASVGVLMNRDAGRLPLPAAPHLLSSVRPSCDSGAVPVWGEAWAKSWGSSWILLRLSSIAEGSQ